MTAFGSQFAPAKGMMTSAGAVCALTLPQFTGLLNLALVEGSYLRTVLGNGGGESQRAAGSSILLAVEGLVAAMLPGAPVDRSDRIAC